MIGAIALVGIVIVVASLLSGAIERVGVPLVAAFLMLGAAVGPFGLGFVEVRLDSPELRVLATLALALVLFSDAVLVDIREIRTHRRLAWTLLGPGTLLPALLIALAARSLLDVSPAAAAILGAALASTDPVLLRSVFRSPGLTAGPRIALRVESGMNDAFLLPIVVLSTLFLMHGGSAPAREIARGALGLFVLGPALGALVGWAGITMLATIRTRVGVRRDYESLYALGLGFAAFAAAEAVGGSGFLSAFAAGLTIAALDVELCDCFLEYGQATSEMLLLLTFVAFGTALIWERAGAVFDPRTVAFAAVALLARSAVLYPLLPRIGVRGREQKIIAFFGPRGLSSLLLILLPVFAGVPEARPLFDVVCLVVLASLVAHGTIIGLFLRRTPHGRTLPTMPLADSDSAAINDRISLDEVRRLNENGMPVVFVDARGEKSFAADPRRVPGSVRIPPDGPVTTSAAEARLAKDATLVVYCA